MTEHAGEIDTGGIADLGPLRASYGFVETGGPEVESLFFRDTVQVLKVVISRHIRHLGHRSSNDMPIDIV